MSEFIAPKLAGPKRLIVYFNELQQDVKGTILLDANLSKWATSAGLTNERLTPERLKPAMEVAFELRDSSVPNL